MTEAYWPNESATESSTNIAEAKQIPRVRLDLVAWTILSILFAMHIVNNNAGPLHWHFEPFLML